MKLSTLAFIVGTIAEPSEASLYASIAIAAVIIACFVGAVIRNSRRRFAIGGVLFIVVACIIEFLHGEDVHRTRMANIEIKHKVRMSRLYREMGLSEEEIAARLAGKESPQSAAPATPVPVVEYRPTPTPYPRPRIVPRATPSPEDILRKYGTPQR